MAQQDTGLGWSANDQYLMTLSARMGVFGTIGGAAYPGQPIPSGLATAADIVTGGMHIGRTVNQDSTYTDYYAATETGVALCYTDSLDNCGAAFYFWFLSPGNDTIVHIVPKGSNGIVGTMITITTNLSAENNLFYRGYTGYTPRSTTTYNVPYFSTRTAACAAVEIDAQNIYKLNPGYAVACFASWYTTEGTNLISPILISNYQTFTALSDDGTTPLSGATETNFILDGMRFYMVLLPGNIKGTVTVSDANVPVLSLEQLGAMLPQKLFRTIADASIANIIVLDAPDPYEIDPSEEGGGDGDDQEDDPVEEQTNPLPSVAGLGFCTVYVPSQSELLAMSSYLWSGNFDVNQVIKLFSNPLDSILGLSAVPVDLVGTSEQIYLGGVALTGITMPRYTGRTAVKVDMGTVTIGERYGAYLDYDPYTEFAIYVPFVGIKNLKADDIMGKTLSLMYDIDILTGACVAYLRPAGGSVLYEWAGQCAQQIPVTSSNWDNIFRNAMTAASTLGTAILAPASAPVLAGAVASAATQAIAAKPRVDRSGALTGVSGWLGQLRPYIIRTIPEAYIPADQNKFIGYPAYINVAMSAISGYNEVASVHLEGIPATGNELAEIESLLKGGVIF